MEGILNSLIEQLDMEVVRGLNGHVVIEREDPEDVVEGLLRERGLI